MSGSLQTSNACPVCGEAGREVFAIGAFPVLLCERCGHQFAPSAVGSDHLAEVYGDEYFFGGGDGYSNYLEEADLLRAQGDRYGTLLAQYADAGRLLDVGCAAGFIAAGLGDKGWTVTGLDPNRTMVDHARDVLGLDAHRVDLEAAPDWEPFDAITLIQVVGHLHNLARAMESVARLTKSGGLCLIEYWRRDSRIALLLGKGWHEYSPPSVLHWFTTKSLDTLMQTNGFSAIANGAPEKYISVGHARSLLSHKLPLGTVLTAPLRLVPDRTLLRYPTFDLAWRLYRRDPISGERP